jgi:uncharacterized coiled-coil protein SlyX
MAVGEMDSGRLGILEGRIAEQSLAIQDLREGLREVNARIDGVNARIDGVNARIDRLFLAMLGIGAAQIALLMTLVVRG